MLLRFRLMYLNVLLKTYIIFVYTTVLVLLKRYCEFLRDLCYNYNFLTTVEPPYATTSYKRPLFQNTKILLVKSL